MCTEAPESLAALRRAFDADRAIRLPGFFDARLLQMVRDAARPDVFALREDEGIAREECMDQRHSALAMLLLIMNDPRVFDLVRRITGCGPIGSFIGRIYQLRRGAGHYDRWHSDVDGARLIGISVNLSDGEFAGGHFELRHVDAAAAEWRVANVVAGDAVLFRIADSLRHRVTEVTGEVPRRAFAGWFQAYPDFLSVLKQDA